MRIPILATLISLSIALPALAEDSLPVLNDPSWQNWQASLPFSRLVLVKDKFEPDEVVIFDHFYKSIGAMGGLPRLGLVSRWGADRILLYSYKVTDCPGYNCFSVDDIIRPTTFTMKIAGQVIKLEGRNGVIRVTPELAQILATAPDQNVEFRVGLIDTRWDGEIGSGTVRAWKSLYKASTPESAPIIPISVPK